MKTKASVKRRDSDDIIVTRRGRRCVINRNKPRNKQRQG